MTDRERLIELIEKGIQEHSSSISGQSGIDYLADYLIANGVIVPKLEMGGMVYTIKFRGGYHHYTRMYNDRLEIVLKPYKPIGKTMTFKKFSCNPTEKIK